MRLSTKNWLLLDGLGALLTAIMCLIVANFEPYIGMPKEVMFVLSGAGFCFAIFSFSSHLWAKKDFEKYLSIILIANTAYCLGTLVLATIHIDQLTRLGIAYFTGEIIIVLMIAYAEFREVKQSKSFQKMDMR